MKRGFKNQGRCANLHCVGTPPYWNIMLSELTQKTKIYQLLHQIDKDLARKHRELGCSYCDGPLHTANYVRKPRGGPESCPDELCVRQSLCCGKEGCRRRNTPPSVLFGRQFYWNVVVLIVITLRQNRLNGDGADKLMRMLGVGPRTLKRWMAYFREVFPSSRGWQALRGRLSSEVRNNHLPADAVNYFIRFSESEELGLVGCLRALYGATPA